MTAAPRPVDELIDSLPALDGNTRSKVLAELLAHGRAAAPGFLRALGDPDVEIRALAADGLSLVADRSAADTLAALLTDSDPRIRARAARGLHRLDDPRALDALIQTFDDFPDFLQDRVTMAATALVQRGLPALPRVGALLSSPEPMTRDRAYHVVQSVVRQLPGEDWPSLWRALGSYDPLDPDDAARERAAEAWRGWIATRAGAAS